MKKNIVAIVFFFILILIYEYCLKHQWLNSYLFPSVKQIYQSFLENKSDLLMAFLSTSINSLFGFLLSVFFGMLLAIIISTSDVLAAALLPFCLFFQTVPLIAVAPLLVVWFGFGTPTVQAASFIASFFPILANTLLGLKAIDEDQLNLFKIYKATKFQILFRLQLPSSFPYIYGGLKTAAGLSIVGAIVGELIAGGGLGGIIDAARSQQRPDLIFAALIFCTLNALIFVFLIDLAFKTINRVRPLLSESQSR